MRVACFLFLSLWAAAAATQTMYKCVNDQRRVTYSNIPCEKQGLNDAGPVADRTTSMPFSTAPKPAPRKDSAKPPAPKDDAEVSRGAAQVKPVSPLIEKLLK
jgi:hypothetical protein